MYLFAGWVVGPESVKTSILQDSIISALSPQCVSWHLHDTPLNSFDHTYFFILFLESFHFQGEILVFCFNTHINSIFHKNSLTHLVIHIILHKFSRQYLWNPTITSPNIQYGLTIFWIKSWIYFIMWVMI